MSPAGEVNGKVLMGMVRSKIDERELTVREAADEIGTSAPTLQRVLAGHVPNSTTVSRLAAWLEVPLDGLMTDHEVETVAQIEMHLRADHNLSPETADSIATVVKEMYRAYAEQGTKKKKR